MDTQSTRSLSLPFFAGIATAGVLGYLYEKRGGRVPSAVKPRNESSSPSVAPRPSPKQSSNAPTATQDAPNTQTPRVEPKLPVQAASPKTQLFSEIREVYDPRRGWVLAPPENELAASKARQQRAFVVHYRESPSGRASEDSIWLEIEADDLLESLRESFPNAVALYDTKPGVSIASQPRGMFAKSSVRSMAVRST